MGYSILRHREIPCNTRAISARCQKGMRLIFLKLVRILCGNTNEPGDVGMNPWKSSLFFLTGRGPEIGLSRERAVCLAEQLTLRAVRCVLDDP